MSWLGIDIGGANLKIADGRGFADARRFALWREPEQLAPQLRRLISDAPAADRVAVTMTGELTDCFCSKTDGARRILRAVNEAVASRPTWIYFVDGRLVPLPAATEQARSAAAANWHALARFAWRFVRPSPGMLLDVGSTTTDLIPLVDGQPHVRDPGDTSRLIRGELVYTGVERSPVCAVARDIPFRGQPCPLAQELFATMRDAYLVVGDLPEDASDTSTADGRPATGEAARVRLARSICADAHEFDGRDALRAAQWLADCQLDQVCASLQKVAARMESESEMDRAPQTFVVCGQGEFLAVRAIRRLGLGAEIVSLTQRCGQAISRCAPAHALATLAREEIP